MVYQELTSPEAVARPGDQVCSVSGAGKGQA